MKIKKKYVVYVDFSSQYGQPNSKVATFDTKEEAEACEFGVTAAGNFLPVWIEKDYEVESNTDRKNKSYHYKSNITITSNEMWDIIYRVSDRLTDIYCDCSCCKEALDMLHECVDIKDILLQVIEDDDLNPDYIAFVDDIVEDIKDVVLDEVEFLIRDNYQYIEDDED